MSVLGSHDSVTANQISVLRSHDTVTANHLGLVGVQAEALADHPLAAGDEAAGGAVLGLVRGLGRAQHHLTSTRVL